MLETRDHKRLALLLQLAAAAAVLPALGVLAETLADRIARPAPAAYDTLARFLPADVTALEVRRSSSPAIYAFEAQTSRREITGEISRLGTLLWLAAPQDPADLPVDLREALLAGPTPGDSLRLERVQLMAYEMGLQRPGGEQEHFLDASGRLLFEAETGPKAGDMDVSETLEDLDAPVARTLRHYLGDLLPIRIKREVELGTRVHTARWRSGYGEQEVKVLDNGLSLFVELPDDEPVPQAVLDRVPSGAEVQALILEAYWLRNADGVILKAALANGRPIVPPKRHAFG